MRSTRMGMRVLGPLMLCLAARAQGPIGTQLPITFPASMAEPYVQSAANALTNATQAGANLVGEAANQGLTNLLSLGNTAFAGVRAAVNSTASMVVSSIPAFQQAQAQVSGVLQNATGIPMLTDVGLPANIAANLAAALAQAPPAVQAPEPQREFERSGLGSALSPAISPGVDGASAANSTATCSITLDSPPTATVTCEPVLLKVTVETPVGKPSGKVTFWSDGVAISPALDLEDGIVAYNYTGFMVGSHSVFATYSGGGPCPLGVSASILRQVVPAKAVVAINPNPSAQSYPSCDWQQQRFDVSVTNDQPHCAAPTGIVNVYLIDGTTWNATGIALPPTDPLQSIDPYSINTRFPVIGQIGQAVSRAGNIFVNTVTQATGSVVNRLQDSPIFRRLIGVGALLPPAVQTGGPSTVSVNLMRQLVGLVPGRYTVIASYAGDQNFQAAYGTSTFAMDISCALPNAQSQG